MRVRRLSDIVLGIAALIAVVFFTANSPEASALDRDQVEAFTYQVAQKICAGERGWLRCYNVDPTACEGIGAALADGCVKEVLEPRSTQLKDESSIKLASEDLYRCLKDSFKARYGKDRSYKEGCASID